MSSHEKYEKMRNLVKSLAVNDTVMKMAESSCQSAKVQKFTAKHLHEDWKNELLANLQDKCSLEQATASPDEAFLNYVYLRLQNPTEPSQRVLSRLVKKFGFEYVLAFHKVLWPREVAWVKVFRNHSDNSLAVHANLLNRYLGIKPVCSFFEGMVAFAHEQNISPAMILADDLYSCDVIEIPTLPTPDHDWEPVALLYAKEFFKKSMGSKSEAEVHIMATQARKSFMEENQTVLTIEALQYLEEFQLPFRINVARPLVKFARLSSNQVDHLYKNFKDEICCGRIILNDETSVDEVFDRYVGARIPSLPDCTPSDERQKKIIASISSHPVNWRTSMPTVIDDLGVNTALNYSKWRDSILSGDRPAPSNEKLDYFLFLVDLHF